MKQPIVKAILAVCVSALGVAAASAPGTGGRISFYAHQTDGNLQGQLTVASIDIKKFTISVNASNVSDGSHEVAIVVYDGNGVEAFHATRSERYKGGYAGASFGYTFDKYDAPGTWWVIATLDGRALAEQQIQISAATGTIGKP